MAHEPEGKPIQEVGGARSIPLKESGPVQTDLPLMAAEATPSPEKVSIVTPPIDDAPVALVSIETPETPAVATPVLDSADTAPAVISTEPISEPVIAPDVEGKSEEKDADYYHRQHEQRDEYHDYSGQHDTHHDTAHHDTGYDPHHSGYEGSTSSGGGGGSTGYVTPPSDPTPEPAEEGGGPVKAFLDHLEDFRWILIKVMSSVLIAMLICLVGGNWLVDVLAFPLVTAQKLYVSGRIYDINLYAAIPKQQTSVPLFLGTNQLSKIRSADLKGYYAGTNKIESLKLAPVVIGTNTVFAIQPGPTSDQFPNKRLVDLINLSPLSAVMVALKLAFYGGIVIAAPFIIFFIGQFVLPALRLREKSLLYQVAGTGTVLFLLGVAFCYFIILPITVTATVEFSDWLGFSSDQWQAEEYIGFAFKFMIAMGAGFQLPVVILTLVKVGLLDHKKLNAFRRYWIVINLVLSAVITPSGDPLTMLIFAAPLHVLYEFCIVVAWFWSWRDRRRAKASSAA